MIDIIIEHIKQALQRKIGNLLLLSLRTASCPLFCPSGNQAIIFLSTSPINLKDWTSAYFEQFKSLGIKHIRPAW